MQRLVFEFQGVEFELVNAHVSGMADALDVDRARELLDRPDGVKNGRPLMIVGDLNGIREESKPLFAEMISAYDQPMAMANQGAVVTAHNDWYISR